MSARTKIEWCDSTFNPWIGCTKVSPACDDCYAARSTPARTLKIDWGAGKTRQRTAKANWNLPWRWNAAMFFQCGTCGDRSEGLEYQGQLKDGVTCISCGSQMHETRRRVFSASLGDWLDNEVPIEWLVDFLDLVRRTPNLDWLLLTKRIGNWRTRIEEARNSGHCNVALMNWLHDWLSGSAPNNVWIGATVVNQAEANRDVPKLLRVPAAIRFLSIEPMLGAVDLSMWIKPTLRCNSCGSQYGLDEKVADPDGYHWGDDSCAKCGADNCMTTDWGDEAAEHDCPEDLPRDQWDHGYKLHWIICGGESGSRARPSHPDWYRSLRDQCAAADVPFLFKQWGEWLPWTQFNDAGIDDGLESTRYLTAEWDNDDWRDVGRPIWSDFADGHVDDEQCVGRVGKARAGRLLDSVEHNGFPTLSIAA